MNFLISRLGRKADAKAQQDKDISRLHEEREDIDRCHQISVEENLEYIFGAYSRGNDKDMVAKRYEEMRKEKQEYLRKRELITMRINAKYEGKEV